ncbi:class I SAM-dependent methyltransferase [Jeotgalibacillus soli]|uniref:Uncharacterized protein n=1 Tax=Jeotgalibacillus soli TaxID=889306 RepID=A0A0C2RID4_9BACL|nr:class I SAM-dependent methyltransferase [Jeotgalibacillus soli]KIL49925.1 hypothetical protein KP78_13930 [Jeotgalibacillus soli]
MQSSCVLCGSKKIIIRKVYSSAEIIDKFDGLSKELKTKSFFSEESFFLKQCADCSIQFFEGCRPGDSSLYETLQQFDWYYQEDKPEFDYVLQKIIEFKPNSILEVGAGQGAFLNKVKDAFSVKASEYNTEAVRELRNKGIELDSENDRYDLIVSFQVLEHVEAPREFIRQQIDKLYPEGHIIFMVPNNDSDYSKHLEDNNILDFPPHHTSRWNKNALLNIGQLFDLELVDYYEEKMRLIHYEQVIEHLRKQLPLYGLFDDKERILVQKEMLKVMNRTILPYEYIKSNMTGHTHGVVFKKKG